MPFLFTWHELLAKSTTVHLKEPGPPSWPVYPAQSPHRTENESFVASELPPNNFSPTPKFLSYKWEVEGAILFIPFRGKLLLGDLQLSRGSICFSLGRWSCSTKFRNCLQPFFLACGLKKRRKLIQREKKRWIKWIKEKNREKQRWEKTLKYGKEEARRTLRSWTGVWKYQHQLMGLYRCKISS